MERRIAEGIVPERLNSLQTGFGFVTFQLVPELFDKNVTSVCRSPIEITQHCGLPRPEYPRANERISRQKIT